MLDIDNGMSLIKDAVACGSAKNRQLEVHGQGKKNQCHVPWKTIVLPAPSQALLISLIIAWRDKEIRTGWKSDKSDRERGVLEFDIEIFLCDFILRLKECLMIRSC